jgi:hypothetical protein
LFFVQDSPYIPQTELILVKRKIENGGLPKLEQNMDWKQTFFLNLISQISCYLTVAICQKNSKNNSSTEQSQASVLLLSSSKTNKHTVDPIIHPNKEEPKDLKDLNTQPSLQKSISKNSLTHLNITTMPLVDTPDKTEHPLLPHIPETNTSTFPSLERQTSQSGSKLMAKQRIVKKVFSAPYKTRMDVKDAFMNECSYPLVYYTVNDYESSSLHLPIHEKEYLCVELCIFIPKEKGNQEHDGLTSVTNSIASSPSYLSNSDDLSPFPTPPDTHKIILFQGAVPHSSIVDVFQQKGLAAQHTLKSSWSKLSDTKSSDMKTMNHSKRMEYIMMRGPRGKGQCQVAISKLPKDEIEESTNEESFKKVKGLTDRLKLVAGAVKSMMINDKSNKSEDSSSLQGLMASITYVNISWQSIVNDLIGFAKETRQSRLN